MDFRLQNADCGFLAWGNVKVSIPHSLGFEEFRLMRN
jgi:hypothetical protein